MIGFIGLGVMGDNLVLNLLDKGEDVIVFNRTQEKAQEFLTKHSHQHLSMAHTLEELCQKLPKPRTIFFMIKAGEAVDKMIEQLVPYLDAGDILIDGGNSYYKDSLRRFEHLQKNNIHFVDCGVSGGAKGARLGPSMMVGGDHSIYGHLERIFSKVAAQTPEVCFDYMGGPALGHFVKMVHNGIEYAQMQIIAEAFHVLKSAGKSNIEISEIFEQFSHGRLSSYLLEISAQIMKFKDQEGFVIDRILDVASEKGTGRWTSLAALELGAPASLISTALEARFISQLREQRVELYRSALSSYISKEKCTVDLVSLEGAMHLASLLCYVQGFAIIRSYAQSRALPISYKKIANVWRGGCIIRSRQLKLISSFESDDFLMSSEFIKQIKLDLPSLSAFTLECVEKNWSVPVFSASLQYLLSMGVSESSASLIQAQRDFFGAHTYLRNDRAGVFHTEWEE